MTIFMRTVIVFCLSVGLGVLIYLASGQYNTSMGVQAVRNLYTFDDESISEQDAWLKTHLTDSLYRQCTIGADTRQLSVFLKYNNLPAEVKVLYVEPGRVLYRIMNERVAESRVFQFEYKLRWGTITEIFESELIPLPPSSTDYYD